MLTEAWTFSVVAQIALFAGIGLAVAGVIVLVAFGFEVVEALEGKETVKAVQVVTGSLSKEAALARRELASVN